MILPVSYIWYTIEETKIQPAMTILIAVLIIFKDNYNAHIKIKQQKNSIFPHARSNKMWYKAEFTVGGLHRTQIVQFHFLGGGSAPPPPKESSA